MAIIEPTSVCDIHFHHRNPTIAVVQPQQCMRCLAHFFGENFQQVLLERVETRTTVSSWSTASNIRGPGRTVGNIISIAGRRLEKMLSTPPEVVLHRKLEQDLKEAKKKLSKQRKVILLGSTDSGKSDLLKQMGAMQLESYSLQEHETFRLQVFEHLTRGMVRILRKLDDLGMVLSVNNQHHAEQVQNTRDLNCGELFPTILCHAFSTLWDDPIVQAIWKNRETYGFPASLSYFFSSLDRLFDIAYTPTNQDILNLQCQTTGTVIETELRRSDGDGIIIDADQCRGRRRKWMHYFEDTECILFVVDLGGYDATQMHDALLLWRSICKSRWFRQAGLVLVFNKYELFKNKIRTSNIKDYFPDYEGAIGDASAGLQYFKKCFSTLAQERPTIQNNGLYMRVTTSQDTRMLQIFLNDLDDMRRRRHLIASSQI